MYNSLVNVLEKNISTNKGITFVINEQSEKFVSYQELYLCSVKMLSVLQKRGLKPGDAILLQIDDNESFLYSFWACLLGGYIPVPLAIPNNPEQYFRLFNIWKLLENPSLIITEPEWDSLEKSAEDATVNSDQVILKQSSVILYSELEKGEEDGIIFHPELDDTAFIMFSSGSTGVPKGAKTSHQNVVVVDEDLIEKFNTTKDDVALHFMPLTHMVGIVFCHLYPLLCSIDQVLMDKRLYFKNPLIWADLICKYHATILLNANFGLNLFLKAYAKQPNNNWDLSNVKVITIGGEAMSYSLMNTFVHALSKYGLPEHVMSPVYGITEAMVVACVASDEPLYEYILGRQHLSIGSVIQSVEDSAEGIPIVSLGAPSSRSCLRICDDSDQVLGPNRIGHVQVSGPYVMNGYYEEKQNKIVFTSDGWYRTGDIGFIMDGQVFVTGRSKDMVIVNMVNYFLFDIERVIEATPDTQLGKVAVVGIQNRQQMTDEILVFVESDTGLSELVNIISHIRHQVKLKMGLEIKDIIPIKEFPMTEIGKVDKFTLKNNYLDGQYSNILQSLHQPVKIQAELETDLEGGLINIVKEVLSIQSVQLEDDFFDLGGQSLTALGFVVLTEQKYGINISPRIIYENPKIENLIQAIKTQQGNKNLK